MRLLAVGDIHGHAQALHALLIQVAPRNDDMLIFMGDYVDKGPDVKGVIDSLLALSKTHNAIFLRGNHDQMLIDAYRDPAKRGVWECLSGKDPLSSYGLGSQTEQIQRIPEEHWAFLENTCRDYFETTEFIFVHGGLRPEKSPAEETPDRLQWTTLSLAVPHDSGKTVICGHSAQPSGRIVDLGHTICIDTGITGGGFITCLALDNFEYWQADAGGLCRQGFLSRPHSGS